MQYIVKLTADSATAMAEFVEFSGSAYYGPFSSLADASEFVREVKAAWEVLGSANPQGFVYGTLSVEVLYLGGPSPVAAALTWWANADLRGEPRDA